MKGKCKAGGGKVKEDDDMAGEKKEAGEKGFKHGGKAKHHVGHHEGHHAHHHAGRKPRKSGGAASGSNMHPLSSAHKGTEPKGHKSYEPEEH